MEAEYAIIRVEIEQIGQGWGWGQIERISHELMWTKSTVSPEYDLDALFSAQPDPPTPEELKRLV